MPGLVGFAGSFNRDAARVLLEIMAHTLKEEDWYQVDLYHDQGFGLGRVSLGILNPEPQPIWNEDETLAIVMEGEVYAYQDLKQGLIDRGHHFRTNSDAEFVLHLFEEYGEEFAIKLNGAFAAAIWDRREKKLVLANDRIGLQPLYYAQRTGRFLFASGVRALLADPDIPRSVDLVAVAQMLSFEHVLDDRTLIREAHLLPPASLVIFSDGYLSIRSYWKLEFQQLHQPLAENAYLEGLIYHLRQAVSRQAPGDLSAGVLLSGGLDSRLIAALLCENQSSDNLHTFTFGIPDCDDARFAKEVANRLGSRHEFIELEPDYLLNAAERAVRLTDGLKSCVHMHAFASLQNQSEFVRTIYKGYMGDPLMGSHLKRQYWADYDEDTLCQMTFAHYNTLFLQTEHEDLFTEDFQSQVKDAFSDSFRVALNKSKAKLIANWQDQFDFLERQRRFILNGVELVRSQTAVRVPFCDKDLLEFALTVPPGLRFDRYLFIKAFVQMFPDLAKIPWESTGFPLVPCARDLRLRLDKQVRWRLHDAGLKWIPVPSRRPYANYDLWMRTVLRDWIEETLLSQELLERGYFKPDYIRRLVAEHMVGANNARKLGVLLTLELWHRQVID